MSKLFVMDGDQVFINSAAIAQGKIIGNDEHDKVARSVEIDVAKATIQSADFEHGVRGWRISEGSIEINNSADPSGRSVAQHLQQLTCQIDSAELVDGLKFHIDETVRGLSDQERWCQFMAAAMSCGKSADTAAWAADNAMEKYRERFGGASE